MISSKTWFVGIVAAILVAFGVFGLGSATTKVAYATEILDCGNGDEAAVFGVVGIPIDCFAEFDDDDEASGDDDWDIGFSGPVDLEATDCIVDADDNDDFDDNSSNCDLLPALVGSESDAQDLDDDTDQQDFRIYFTVTCTDTGLATIDATHDSDTAELDVVCEANTAAVSLDCVATPTTLETHPVGSSTNVSIIICTVLDGDDDPIDGIGVLALADTGVIDDPEDFVDEDDGDDENGEASCVGVPNGEDEDTDDVTPLQEEDNTDSGDDVDDTEDDEEDGTADFIFCATVGSTLGPTTIDFIVHNNSDDDIDDLFDSVTITIVGPPDSWTLTVNKTKVVCGEKIEWSLTGIVDKIKQTVSDGTLVSVWSNFGTVVVGAIGAPGSDAVFGGDDDTLELFTVKGEVSGFLLTDPGDVGIYELLVGIDTDGNSSVDKFVQKAIECTAPAAPAPVPTTAAAGLGGPSTGDGGLLAASSTSSSALLYSIAGALAFALAGVATLRFARR